MAIRTRLIMLSTQRTLPQGIRNILFSFGLRFDPVTSNIFKQTLFQNNKEKGKKWKSAGTSRLDAERDKKKKNSTKRAANNWYAENMGPNIKRRAVRTFGQQAKGSLNKTTN